MSRLTRQDLEDALTDVRAEACLLEAELQRAASSSRETDDEASFGRPHAAAERIALIEARLEELEARTAGLRARLQQLASAQSPPVE